MFKMCFLNRGRRITNANPSPIIKVAYFWGEISGSECKPREGCSVSKQMVLKDQKADSSLSENREGITVPKQQEVGTQE